MNDKGMTNYLVFEAAQNNTVTEHNYTSGRYSERPAFALVPYVCVGAVRAVDESAAIRAVMASTRRISKYAVIPATFLDFTVDMDAEDVDARPVLNP